MKVHQGAYTYTLELDAPILNGKTSFALIDTLPKNLAKEWLSDLKKLVDQHAEGVWVQSRFMVVFGLTPPDESETTPSTIEVSLRASTDSDDEEEGVTFSCVAGKDGRTRLHFSDKTKKEEAKRISNGLWKILLSEPSELDDYTAETVDKSGAKVAYGVRDGRCFFGDPDDEDIDIPSVVAAGGRGGKGAFDDFDPVGMVDEDDDQWMRGDNEWGDDEEDEDDEDSEGSGFSFLSSDDDEHDPNY